jgi:hypothetical protein
VGSIVGPAIGGVLLSMGWMPQRNFLAGMAPALLACFALLASGLVRAQAGIFRTGLRAAASERSALEIRAQPHLAPGVHFIAELAQLLMEAFVGKFPQ